jgi:hypothetical protein
LHLDYYIFPGSSSPPCHPRATFWSRGKPDSGAFLQQKDPGQTIALAMPPLKDPYQGIA